MLTTNQDQIQLGVLYSTLSALTSEILGKNPANPVLTGRSRRREVAPSSNSCTKPWGLSLPAAQELGLGRDSRTGANSRAGPFNFLAHCGFEALLWLFGRIKKAEVGGRRTLDLSLCVQPYILRPARRFVREVCGLAPHNQHKPIGDRRAILLTDPRSNCICPV